MRKLLAIAAAAGLMTISGAAFSGAAWQADVQLLTFETETGQLIAEFGGDYVFFFNENTAPIPGIFRHTHGTPPDPCDGLKREFNAQVSQWGGPGTTRVALMIAIKHLSDAQCPAQVTVDASDGHTLLGIQPL